MSHFISDFWDALFFSIALYTDKLLRLDKSVLYGTLFACSYFFLNLPKFNVDAKAFLFRFFKNLPVFNWIMKRQVDKAIRRIHESVHDKTSRINYVRKLPEYSRGMDEVLIAIRKYKAMEHIKWCEGASSGAVYANDNTLTELSAKVFKEFAWTNPLHPELFPDIRRMEAEIIRMCLTMFHGDELTCGTVTSGGTESIILACLAYRELARERGINNPVIIVPRTVHTAFDKAAFYLSMDVVHIPVDPVTQRVDLFEMEAAITSSTCMLVGSAPGYPYGIIDPIKEISKLGEKYKIPVHVDCCLGGFLLPFMEDIGFNIEPFDFRLSGVTSISCDTHKYGFTVKGTSVIMYRDSSYRTKQYFVFTTWPGGMYASPTLAGSRPGSIIAASWASMIYHGRSGYCKSTERIVSTTRFIASELKKIPGIFVIGDPKVCVVAFGSKQINIYFLAEALMNQPNNQGWLLNNLQFPPAVHLCVTDQHTRDGLAERFVNDVVREVEKLRKQPYSNAEGLATFYGTSQTIPDRSLVATLAEAYLDACYDTPKCEK